MILSIVLAAGHGSRMGRAKPLLPCGETTFIGAILDTLGKSRVDEVRVVLGRRAEEIRSAAALPDPICTVNENPDAGMLSSLQCGIRSLPRQTRGFLVWPVDHPLVKVQTVDALVDAFLLLDPPIALPVHEGRRGHPVLFSGRLAMDLMEAPLSEGARAVVREHAGDRLEVPVIDPGILTDIDTPETYADVFGHPLD